MPSFLKNLKSSVVGSQSSLMGYLSINHPKEPKNVSSIWPVPRTQVKIDIGVDGVKDWTTLVKKYYGGK